MMGTLRFSSNTIAMGALKGRNPVCSRHRMLSVAPSLEDFIRIKLGYIFLNLHLVEFGNLQAVSRDKGKARIDDL